MRYLARKINVVAHRDVTRSRICVEAAENESQSKMTRRKFIGTLSAGATVFALNGYRACAASSTNAASSSQFVNSSPAPSTSVRHAGPKWSTVPTITFTEGVPATISIAMYVSDADSVSIVKNSAALPTGVTYDVATKSIVYDGVGAVGFTDGHVLKVLEA